MDRYPDKKCSRYETSPMNFSNLISSDNWTFHYQKKIICDQQLHHSHKSNNTNKSLQRYSIKQRKLWSVGC